MKAYVLSILLIAVIYAGLLGAPAFSAESKASDDALQEILKSIPDASSNTKSSDEKSSPNSSGTIPPENATSIKTGPCEADFSSFPFDHNILPEDYLTFLKSPGTDLKKVASSLMERKKQFMLRWEDPANYVGAETFPKSLDEVELLCIFPDKYIDFVIKNGQLNLHQVRHSRGVCEPAIRAHAEDFMVGIHLENKYEDNPNSPLQYLRPKYGFVNFLKPCGIKVNPFRLLQYGTVLIVYEDAVKQRSSYTYGDSLASYCEAWEITLHPLDPVPLTMLRPPGPEDKSNCRYVEAQMWGPIELKDIKEFRIPSDRKDLLEVLNASGKPVFSYDRSKMESNDYFMDVSECGWNRGEPLNQLAIEQVKKSQVAQK